MRWRWGRYDFLGAVTTEQPSGMMRHPSTPATSDLTPTNSQKTLIQFGIWLRDITLCRPVVACYNTHKQFGRVSYMDSKNQQSAAPPTPTQAPPPAPQAATTTSATQTADPGFRKKSRQQPRSYKKCARGSAALSSGRLKCSIASWLP